MTSTQQFDELKKRIWQIANDVRGTVDGWDFKHYVLGALFYRFISENFTHYIEGGDESIDYASLEDDVITDDIRDDAIKTKGYFIYPSQLFANLVANAASNDDLNTDLKAIFTAIESSAMGYDSEEDIKGLFSDFDTTSNRLGNTVKNKNARLCAVLKGVDELEFGNFQDSEIDLFGDAYEYLIGNYAANAGKSGGEFFTPQRVSKLIAQLAICGQDTVNKIYDPAAGSGSLLLQAKKHMADHLIEDGFFGQEVNYTTYNLARMNMFLHNVNYDNFNLQHGDTLRDPRFLDSLGIGFDAIVSNPPYSVKWIGKEDPTLINDDRFAPAGVLAPKSKADFAFVLHCLHYLSPKGRAAIVCFPGIFYRSGAEQKIRQYLVENNAVETVIALAPNLFYGTTIAVNILVLSKHKTDTKVQFIDASGEAFYDKGTNTNLMTDDHVAAILKLFEQKEEVAHVATSVRMERIAENDFNLSVSSYVEPKDTREKIDITQLNADIDTTVAKIDRLRNEIDAIVAEIEGSGGMSDIILYTSEDGLTKVDLKLGDGTVWLSQLQIAELFQTSKQNISKHIHAIYEDGELDRTATVNQQLTVQKEGSREVSRTLTAYSLDMNAYFDLAELNVIKGREMKMEDYVRELDTILTSAGRKCLDNAGTISSRDAKEKAKRELKKYKARTLDPVEKDYLDTINTLAKKSKDGSRKKGGQP